MTRHKYVTAMPELLPARKRLAAIPPDRVITQPGRDSMGRPWLMAAVEMAAVASGSWPLSPDPGPREWTCFPQLATRTQGRDARSIRAARDFTCNTLRRWGVTERCDDVAIVVSELLTNAQRYALPGPGRGRPSWPIRLGLLRPGPCVLCAVADPSPAAPVAKDPGDLAETGRGLHVVGSLSDQWGYTTYSTAGGTGKVVWAVFVTLPAQASPSMPGAAQ